MIEIKKDETSSENLFLILDGKNILGKSKYILTNEHQAEISELSINVEAMKLQLMDGIIRCILNYLDHRAVKKVCIHNSLIRENEANYVDLEKEVDSEYYYAILPDFFEKPCKGKKNE